MSIINGNFDRLTANYLFAEVSERVAAYKRDNPDKKVISLGIGDVTLPLAPVVTGAIKEAAAEMEKRETFRGYGPYEGYDFLRNAIASYYRGKIGVTVDPGEIFAADGAKNDLGGILDLFRQGITALVPDPVYPAYVDVSNITGNSVVYANGTEDNGFLPGPPEEPVDLVYLCSPNNPTGAVYTKDALKAWVDYANGCGAVILYDAAYESFITDRSLPRSIFEIEGARTCAVELCSFSKTAGFTGVRAGYTVIPKELERDGKNLHALWTRRIAIKYNGASYIIQRGAAAVFSPEGYRQVLQNTAYYLRNAKVMGKAMKELGIPYTGGSNSPYIWFRCPKGRKSWEVFDLLLNGASVVCTPGAGFGANGEGWVRLTAFGTAEDTAEAMERIRKVLA